MATLRTGQTEPEEWSGLGQAYPVQEKTLGALFWEPSPPS